MGGTSTRELHHDGLRFSYQRVPGETRTVEPVLVVGGVLQSMRSWSILHRHVLPYADLVTVDLPGAGDSTPLRAEQDMDTMCRVLDAVLDDLGAERVNLLGYSFGSAVAYRCAQRRPERIARLALGGVPVRISDKLTGLWHRGAERMASGDPGALVDTLMEMFLCPAGEATVRNRDIVRRLVRRMTLRTVTDTAYGLRTMERSVLENLDPVGGLTGVPTLVFCGEHDTISSAAEQHAFAATIDGSRFAAIGEADHWLFLQRREEAGDLVMRHFTGRPFDGLPYLAGPGGGRPAVTADAVR
ncbi:alpha/beta fold hydrolase [Streptomyces lichenis]|uniref:Alpha/beta hydrolase n=1 Tax=Streptomyces lichenis TaxID=2306967 RepID=A0ABT0I9Z0_9ACTN|nr:alpha/beta hydrolase [Streptomyces lichenis]MCK8678135.1 alpha/beta hydrolase [Streptomyces lichenis]